MPLKQSIFYRDTAATKTLTLELYVPDATTFYLDEIGLSISYTDSDDVFRNEYMAGTAICGMSKSALPRTALAASAAAWTANGVAGFSSKKLEITTQYAVKQNSEITVRLLLMASRSPSIVFYVSPLVGVS